MLTITTFPRVILLSVPPLLPTSALPWPMLCQFLSDRHYPCHLPLPPHANWSLGRAVSVVHTHRKSLRLASLSTRFPRLIARMMACTPIRLLGQKPMGTLRRSRMRGLRYRLHVNASMRSRVLLLGPDDLQVLVTRLVRPLDV